MNSKNELGTTREFQSDLELQIDRICDAFELSYQRNENPRIEEFLDETVGGVETQLAEMVMVELAYRKQAGETPTLEEYASRFPTYSEVLKQLSELFLDNIPAGCRIPPRVAHLESFEFLGAGSFGVVWKAWDTSLHRFVAVKTPIRPVPTPSDRQLIQREARIVAKAKHPYVVPVHSAGEAEGRVYVVYEFVPGETLKERLLDGLYTPQEAAALCARIADALHHVHQLGIIHRDLKPANILIDPAGAPHVMDFGLAKLLDTTSTIGVTDNPLGTPAYMSPEQAQGKSKETDGRSDIYSVGVILYELVSGRHVFQGNRQELLHQIQHDPPPSLCQRVLAVPRELELICFKCLEKKPDDRYATAADLAADLRRWLRGQPVLARPVSRRRRTWRWLYQHRLAVILAIVALLPLCAWGIQLGMGPAQPAAAPQIPGIPPMLQTVYVTTEPPGAIVSVVQCDSQSGEPVGLSRVAAIIEKSPGVLSLLPGRYRVFASLVEPDGVRKHEVHRTVPGPASWPSMSANFERYQTMPNGDVQWPAIKLPPLKPLFEMAYVAGTDSFTVSGSPRPRKVAIAPFWVSTREYTFGDFLTIRPGFKGNTPDKDARLEPPQNALPTAYQWAEQWAEESGCRLLSDIEFAYLAHLAEEAQARRKVPADAAATFDVAGGSTLDEIPTVPPIRGILTGYAEWTRTWPGSPLATINLTDMVENPKQPALFRIIRGGTILCSARDYPRDPDAADVASIYSYHPHIGFRLARTADTDTPSKSGN